MKQNKSDFFAMRTSTLHTLVLLIMLPLLSACSKYDLDKYSPEGWGASIYSYLDNDGNFTNTVKLIDALGYTEVLNKTGSKTLFVADDDAFARFYASNNWGVTRFEDLTKSQMKMLLLGSMINSSYQLNDLSSIEGPVEGQCMRRLSSQTIFDTIPTIKVNDLPNMLPEDATHNNKWQRFANRDNIVLMKDNTEKPMIHFIEGYVKNHKMTNADYDFLYNNTTTRKSGDASVNGVQIKEPNIKCSNGFIHIMEDVMLPLDNMAEIMAHKPQVSQFNKLLQRFCAPFYVGKETTDQYNYLNGTNIDSVFQMRFFSSKSQGGTSLTTDDYRETVKSYLTFDPAWNTYYSGLAQPSAAVAMEKDMSVMMAPTDAAMDNYWNNEAGRVLKDQYGTWDNVPNDVVVELLNNNMLTSFIESIPSKFDEILNDANDPMGVTEDAIDSVWLGCNGAVYLTNKVFSPTSFVSVLYPAIVNESMKIIKWAVEQNQYNVYLNSLNSYYSFFIPTNKSLLSYIDPASFGKSKTQIYQFHYDASLSNPVWASVYEYDLENKTIGDSIGEDRNTANLKSRLKDVLDAHIVVGNVEDGNTYYRTKGGQEIRVKNAAMGINGMTVEGSYQINDTGSPLKVTYIYDQTKQGNGKCYILDEQPLLSTRSSVIDIMRQHPEMSEMCKLLEGSSLLETIHDENYACARENISCFGTYHYTVYVPTNEAILALQKAGKLPTWDKVAEEEEHEDFEAKTRDSLAIENFIQYHIQDYALFLGSEPLSEEGYETAYINTATGKFERLYVTLDTNDITIKTSQTDNNPRHVVKNDGLYNLMAREYQLNTSDAKEATNIYTSSTAVIHLIDGALVK